MGNYLQGWWWLGDVMGEDSLGIFSWSGMRGESDRGVGIVR